MLGSYPFIFTLYPLYLYICMYIYPIHYILYPLYPLILWSQTLKEQYRLDVLTGTP